MNYYLDKIYADKEFIATISDIIENPIVQEMKNYRQHYETNCFDHCLMASYLCYHFCKKYNLDYVSVARAAMLHDLFLYDWRKRQPDLPSLRAGRRKAPFPEADLRGMAHFPHDLKYHREGMY